MAPLIILDDRDMGMDMDDANDDDEGPDDEEFLIGSLAKRPLSTTAMASEPGPSAASAAPADAQMEPQAPEPAQPHAPVRPPPINVAPKVHNAGHRAVIQLILPHLRSAMLSVEHCNAQPRQQVHRALMAVVDRAGERMWGANQLCSRKRTVEDLILRFYYDEVRRRL